MCIRDSGKTLGIVGLGSIGRQVVKRARAFEMRIVAHDPYVTAKIAHDLGVEMLDLAALYGVSDYITLHVAATPETLGKMCIRDRHPGDDRWHPGDCWSDATVQLRYC